MNIEELNSKKLLILIIAVSVVGIIASVGVFFWQKQELAKVKADSDKKIKELSAPKAENKEEKKTEDPWLVKFKEMKFRNIVLAWNKKGVLTDPNNSNVFYYVGWANSEQTNPNAIYKFDISKIKDFEKDTVTVSPTSGDIIYKREVRQGATEGHFFRLIGFDERKLVFLEDYLTNSPGPCDSLWLGPNLEYINPDDKEIKTQKYTVSKEIETLEKGNETSCKEDLKNQ